jgi:hypothetical protein
MDSTIKALHKNIAEWMAGPTGAVLLHLSIIIALLFLVDFSREPDDPVPVEITCLKLDVPKFDPPPPEIIPPPDFSVIPPEVLQPEPEITQPEELLITDIRASEPPLTADQLEIPKIESMLIFEKLTAGQNKDRIGEESRRKAGETYGKGWAEYAEASVQRALEWLRINQNADGSWGTNDKEAMAGLGLLTYLAHGETTASEKYGETVKRAIQYLVARQNEAGEFAKTDTTAGTYSQAICVYALSEAYGMTRILALKSPMEKGVEVLIQGQQAGGGFDYRFEKSARRDTSLGGWCSQALKAAFIAGADNLRLKTAMDLAVADMKSVQKEDGSFYYSRMDSHTTHGITAVAVLSMQLLGHDGERDAVKGGLNYLRSAECNWKNPPNWPMYAWYYISQTKFHQGGGSWTSWNNQFAPQFIRNQNPDGSWTSAGLTLKEGSTGRENMHPVYATTLAALTLQVYYRCLPTYKPIEEQAVEIPDEDVKVDIL